MLGRPGTGSVTTLAEPAADNAIASGVGSTDPPAAVGGYRGSWKGLAMSEGLHREIMLTPLGHPHAPPPSAPDGVVYFGADA